MNIRPIAHFLSPFHSKFGIPKQSGLVPEIKGEIVFEKKYRSLDAIRGLERFDYLWLIWGFSANKDKKINDNERTNNNLTVRPPLLGGNERRGVFATRSPFRPNDLGLSSVKLERINLDSPLSPTLIIRGADLMNDTPIYDIKPYIENYDSHINIKNGFVDDIKTKHLDVIIHSEITKKLSSDDLQILQKTLELDPRPHYHKDPNRIYGMPFMKWDVKFKVNDEENTLLIIELAKK